MNAIIYYIGLSVLIIVGIANQSCTSIATNSNEDNKEYSFALPAHPSIQDSLKAYKRMQLKVRDLNAFIKNNESYNSYLFFLLDMHVESNHYRFFVYDNNAKKILLQGLVAHGVGSMTDNEDSLYFSNIPESNCSSLGKYKIGEKYTGRFGTSYKLYGLDATNSNAYNRAIVLHAFKNIPNEECNYPITLSLGCPMVSTQFFSKFEKIIDTSDKNMLMWMY
ncbi:MAG: murein L,D-transpeptidase catalytic domain-containing protein [Bacteroidota bacterium]